jgi:hypothetical protein
MRITLEQVKQRLYDTGIKFNAQDLRDKLIDHNDYFEQFSSNAVVEHLLRFITKDRILNSKDPHFNDIPLQEWDKCSGLSVNKDNNILFCFIPGWRFLAMSNMFTQNKETAVPCLSHCDCTCLLKAAARKIKRSEEALKCGY